MWLEGWLHTVGAGHLGQQANRTAKAWVKRRAQAHAAWTTHGQGTTTSSDAQKKWSYRAQYGQPKRFSKHAVQAPCMGALLARKSHWTREVLWCTWQPFHPQSAILVDVLLTPDKKLVEPRHAAQRRCGTHKRSKHTTHNSTAASVGLVMPPQNAQNTNCQAVHSHSHNTRKHCMGKVNVCQGIGFGNREQQQQAR